MAPTNDRERLRQQHRQRLIGVIVLALVTVVAVPWLMEQSKAPKSLAVAVSKTSSSAVGADTSVMSLPSKIEPQPSSTAASVGPSAAEIASSPVPESDVQSVTLEVAPTKPKVSPSRAVDPASSTARKIVTEEPVDLPIEAPAKLTHDKHTGSTVQPQAEQEQGQWIQVGVFAHHERVLLLDNKLHKLGLSSQIESFVTREGGVRWRVRVGPFAGAHSCHQALNRLASLGVKGMVVPQ